MTQAAALSNLYRTLDAIARAQVMLEAAPWTFAKSMPKIPHHYTLLSACIDASEFLFTVRVLEANSYERPFWKKMYRYTDIGAFTYWHMDANAEACDLINRKAIGA